MGGLAGGWPSPGRCGGHPPTLQPKAAWRHRTHPPYPKGAPTMTRPRLARQPQPAFPPSGGLRSGSHKSRPGFRSRQISAAAVVAAFAVAMYGICRHGGAWGRLNFAVFVFHVLKACWAAFVICQGCSLLRAHSQPTKFAALQHVQLQSCTSADEFSRVCSIRSVAMKARGFMLVGLPCATVQGFGFRNLRRVLART